MRIWFRCFATTMILVTWHAVVGCAPAWAQGMWFHYAATELDGTCPEDTVRFCLPDASPTPRCMTKIDGAGPISYPKYRDLTTGCTMGEIIPQAPSEHRDGGWHICSGAYVEGFIRYSFVSMSTDVEGLDCDDRWDDDGDGRVNEEWPDGVDNDGDLAVDEDLRCEIMLVDQIDPAGTTSWGRLKARYGR